MAPIPDNFDVQSLYEPVSAILFADFHSFVFSPCVLAYSLPLKIACGDLKLR